jgi:hypothetical protein
MCHLKNERVILNDRVCRKRERKIEFRIQKRNAQFKYLIS